MEQAAAPDSGSKSLSKKVLASVLYQVLIGLTGLLVGLLWLGSFFVRVHRKVAILSSTLLLGGVTLQILLNKWLLQFKLMPVVVMADHLTALLVCWFAFWTFLRVNLGLSVNREPVGIGLWVRFAFLLVVVEIALGNWVSGHYAGMACPDFPACLGSWWPQADYLAGFSPMLDPGLNYQGGVLSHGARVAINWTHRLGAVVSFLALGGLAVAISSSRYRRKLRKAGVLLSVLLLVEVGLGVASVVDGLSVAVVVGHSSIASLLLMLLLYIDFWSSRQGALPAEELQPGTADTAVADALSGVARESEVAVEPVSLYQRLSSQLGRTRSGLSAVFQAIPLGKKEIDAELLEDIESTLLLADIGVDATREIIDKLTASVERNQLGDSDALKLALRENLLDILKPCDAPLSIESTGEPFVILVVGVNGVGKTTTIGKLAKSLQMRGLSVMLAAGDTFRAAAMEQLQIWGERNDVPVIAQHSGADSASVVYDALQSAQARGIDVLIVDTAGRLHTKDNLMEELRKVKRIMAKLDPAAPHEVLLVVDAGTGQNALSQAEHFHRCVNLTGIALTKLDGTAKGGVIFALARKMEIPIRFVGVGEGINDLQDFNAENFIEALFPEDPEH
jgi:fused signal recognition particle receptor